MPYGVASPRQVAMLTRVLDAYCSDHGIPDGLDREAAGVKILTLFNGGHRTARAILTALRKEDRGRRDR